jgi:hypothetical protein
MDTSVRATGFASISQAALRSKRPSTPRFVGYSNSAKFYVYLSDISSSAFDNNDKPCQLLYESAFRQSR